MTVAPSFSAAALNVSRSCCQRSSLSVSSDRPMTGLSLDANAAAAAAKKNRARRAFMWVKDNRMDNGKAKREACRAVMLDNPKLLTLAAAAARGDELRAAGR